VAGSCDQGNEVYVSVKAGEFSLLAEWLLSSQGPHSMKLVT
jgi:hypothetical protein